MIPLLIEAAIRALALGVVAWSGLRLLRVTDPRLEKIIWSTVLACSLAMPWLMRMPVAHGWTLAPVVLHADSVPAAAAVFPAHANVLLAIYLVVATILTTRLAVGLCRMLLIRYRAESVLESWVGADNIRISDRIESPATFGSTILLPVAARTWSRSQRDSILAHERAHARHFDGYIQWLAALHACLFWFSPFAWWLRGRLADLAERISDDVALSGNTTPAEYAGLLLSMASRRGEGWVAVSMARGGVSARIERILADDYRGSRAGTLRRSLIVLAVIPVVALAAGAATVSAKQSKPVAASAPQTSAGQSHSGAAKESSKDDSFGMDPNGPHIVESPSEEELEKYYPAAAMHGGVEGDVQITVTLDREGRATDTLILSEAPLDQGFGAAASQLAHLFTYANPTGHAAAVTYHIKFALTSKS